MPRKPNYKFERSERDKLKAAKKAERLQAKAAKADAKKAGSDNDADAAPADEEAPNIEQR